MGFWEGERCEYCGGKIIEKKVDFTRKIGNRYFLFKAVPAGVCSECGIRNFSASTLKTIEQKARDKKGVRKVLQVPVLSF